MSRYHARYNETGKVYEVVDGVVTVNKLEEVNRASYYIAPDIQPYKSTVTGELIGSRSSHRAHLKQHNLVEIGNEKPRPGKLPDVGGRREAIIENLKRHKVTGFA